MFVKYTVYEIWFFFHCVVLLLINLFVMLCVSICIMWMKEQATFKSPLLQASLLTHELETLYQKATVKFKNNSQELHNPA